MKGRILLLQCQKIIRKWDLLPNFVVLTETDDGPVCSSLLSLEVGWEQRCFSVQIFYFTYSVYCKVWVRDLKSMRGIIVDWPEWCSKMLLPSKKTANGRVYFLWRFVSQTRHNRLNHHIFRDHWKLTAELD